MEFLSWSKIPRFNREWEITEKIDGTNGVLYWTDQNDGRFDSLLTLATVDGLHLFAGSRKRWLSPGSDNFGFATWAKENAEGLRSLGPGRHYGEWYGQGINRGYGLLERRFALFNTKFTESWDFGIEPDQGFPKGVDVVPVLTTVMGQHLNSEIRSALDWMKSMGSSIAPGFENPEGIVVRHVQHGDRFKVLLEGDELPKGLENVPGNA